MRSSLIIESLSNAHVDVHVGQASPLIELVYVSIHVRVVQCIVTCCEDVSSEWLGTLVFLSLLL